MPNLVSNFFTITVQAAAPPPSPLVSTTAWNPRQIPLLQSPYCTPADGASYGGAKHVCWAWHPINKRIYTWGGDYGSGAGHFSYDGGTGTDQQLEGGAAFTTNQPTNPNHFTEAQGAGAGTTSYRNDQYSVDPYAASSVGWRLEQPYLPIALGGTTLEVKPCCNCQETLVWDPVRSRFLGIITEERGAADGFMYNYDPWAMGSVLTATPGEPTGTWAWIPNANGAVSGGPAGQWTQLTTAAVVCKTNGPNPPAYTGNRLYTGDFDERIAFWQYDPTTDRCYAFAMNNRFFIFNPGTLAYEWRALPSSAQGYTFFNPCSTSVAVWDGYIYGIGIANNSTGHVSILIRVKLGAALNVGNGGTVPTSAMQTYLLPSSLSPSTYPGAGTDPRGVWEAFGAAPAKWQEHAGVMQADGKIVIAQSYDGVIDSGANDTTNKKNKINVFIPSTQTFFNETPPQNFAASSWAELPDTSECIMGLTTNQSFPGNVLWRYRPTHVGTLRLTAYNNNAGIGLNPPPNEAQMWQSGFTTIRGTITEWGIGDHGSTTQDGVREFNPTLGTASYVIPNSTNSVPGQYDNRPMFYIPNIDSFVVFNNGQANLTTDQWVITSGTTLVSTASNSLFYPDASVNLALLGALPGGPQNTMYNPGQAWNKDLNCGILFSSGAAGDNTAQPIMWIFCPPAGLGVSVPNTYYVYQRSLPATISGFAVPKMNIRDGMCFAGKYVYWIGGSTTITRVSSFEFWRMDITPHLTSKTVDLTNGSSGTGMIEHLGTVPVGGEFCLLRYDPYTNTFLAVNHQGIFTYDLTNSIWTNITSQTTYAATWNTSNYNNVMPDGCQGDFVDVCNGQTLRKFYFRAGSGGNAWLYDPSQYAVYRSVKLSRTESPTLVSISTSFPATENPISEGGTWTNGAAVGGSWHNVQTTAGKAFATAFVGANAPQRYSDDIAIHSGTFSADQAVQGTVFIATNYRPVSSHECELLLRFSITSGNAHGYEVLRGVTGGGQAYMAVVKWNGALGDFTTIYDSGAAGLSVPYPVNGDTFRAEIIGNTLRVYLNGNILGPDPVDLTRDAGGNAISVWTGTGQPGIGFWPTQDGPADAVLANYGWSKWNAWSYQ